MGVVTDSSRLEFFVLGLEVEVMHQAGKMFGSFEFALDECLVDDQLHGDVCQFTSLPCLYLLSHRLEIVLHAVNAHRGAVNERKRLRVFREHGRKHSADSQEEDYSAVLRGSGAKKRDQSEKIRVILSRTEVCQFVSNA